MTRPFTRVFREAVELRIMAEREERMRETRGKMLPMTPGGNPTHDDRDALKRSILETTASHRSLTPAGVARLCECSRAHVIKTQRAAGVYRAPIRDTVNCTWRMPD